MKTVTFIAGAIIASAGVVLTAWAESDPEEEPPATRESCIVGGTSVDTEATESAASPCCTVGETASAVTQIVIAEWKDNAPRGLGNDVCPVSGEPVSASAFTLIYQGFAVRLGKEYHAEKFSALKTAEKDNFIAQYVEPVGKTCVVSPSCPNPPDAPAITYRGNVAKVCCPRCLRWWGEANEEARRDVWERYVRGLTTGASIAEGRAQAQTSSTNEALPDQITSGVVLLVEGMTCDACVGAVEKSLAFVEGVDLVGVDLESGVAWIGYEENAPVASEQPIAAVVEAGFTASVVPANVVQQVIEASQTEASKSSPCGAPQIRPKKAAALRGQG